MHSKAQSTEFVFATLWQATTFVLALFIVLALVLIFAQPAQGQALEVIYNFTGGLDGDRPQAGLTMDQAGNLYGTTCGASGLEGPDQSSSLGTVFKLSRKGSGWAYTRLYAFQGGMDGTGPCSRVIIGPDGSLYGTTVTGGLDTTDCRWNDPLAGCGTVFKLSPPPQVPPSLMGNWTKTVLHYFIFSDGAFPILGDLTFDQTGNIYGTTFRGGAESYGAVYKLTPTNGGWTESVLYSFPHTSDGAFVPTGGVVFDAAGNLYGTAWYGGQCGGVYDGLGTVFQLTPSGADWIEKDLYCFQAMGDGEMPFAGVIFDEHGNLYGATTTDSQRNDHAGGTLFKLDASQGWGFNLLYHFVGDGYSWMGPWTSLTSTDGPWGEKNFYGTTHADGQYGRGSVFSWTYECTGSTCDWQLNALWEFGGAPNDGASPISNLTFDTDGYAYGLCTRI